MTNREKRVINAFKTCIESGEFTPEYATILIENNTKYGWITDAAKDEFYEWLDAWEAERWKQEIIERGKNATAEILSVEYEDTEKPEEDSEEAPAGEDPEEEPAEEPAAEEPTAEDEPVTEEEETEEAENAEPAEEAN